MEIRVYKEWANISEVVRDPITVMQEKEIINMIFWSLLKCNQVMLTDDYYEKLEKLFSWKHWSKVESQFSEPTQIVVLDEFFYKDKLEITLEQTPSKTFYILKKITSPGFNFECKEFNREKKYIMLDA